MPGVVIVALFVSTTHAVVIALPVSGEVVLYLIPPTQLKLSNPYTQYQYCVNGERPKELKVMGDPTLSI